MRGKGTQYDRIQYMRGITPAYAGKRKIGYFYEHFCWDHPRLCGEKQRIIRALFLPAGSPPPMRGKAKCVNFFRRSFGITPAYAGKSRCKS